MRLRASLLLLAGLVGVACSPAPPPEPLPESRTVAASEPSPTFIDETSCAGCHPAESEAWAGSHHDLAMQPASAESVLGDFDDALFEAAGSSSRFRRDGDRYLVSTEGAEGESVEFKVSEVFGVAPLQQLLIDFPGGRKQALSVAWDAPGERWYHLYPDERIGPDDELHWTRRAQNWNWQCAECHATDLKRGWNAELGGYETTAHRFDVGCQACHGPGSAHAERPEDERMPGMQSEGQVETCARCHSRRAPIGDGHLHGNRLMDDYLPALLRDGLYHADGQVLDEVYVWGSFVQSKMHAKGVRCSDCHDPHSATTRAPGNGTCTVCHSPGGAGAGDHVDVSGLPRKDYDSAAHHFHPEGGPGANCVDCHAPATTYMVVDPRRDHSFRIPRPDVSARLGTPDACTGCHADHDADWAAGIVAEWYGPDRRREPTPGEAIHAGRKGLPGAADSLLALVADRNAPAIFRATALELGARYPGRAMLAAAGDALRDPDPLVRLAALEALGSAPANAAEQACAPLLDDPVRGIRIAAGRRLATRRPGSPALQEWLAAQHALGGQPEALLALAALAQEQGRSEEALDLLRSALQLDPAHLPSALNLADLQAQLGDEAAAERTLRRVAGPSAPLAHHALGLSLVRQGRQEEAITELARAARLSPQDARLGFVHAVALKGAGRDEQARRALESLLERVPWDRDARLSLAEWLATVGDREGARTQLEALRAINPFDPALQAR
jgi:Flp pilus assembly protein TadD